jgi:S1-C subfamily serine protease
MCAIRRVLLGGLALPILLWHAATCGVALSAEARAARPQEPLMGFQGTLVTLPANGPVPTVGGEFPNRGIRIDKIKPGTPAAKAGLEPGDIIVSVDLMRFTSYKGYFHALKSAGQRPLVWLVDKRTGKLVHRNIDLPHEQLPENERRPKAPDTYMVSIDPRPGRRSP